MTTTEASNPEIGQFVTTGKFETNYHDQGSGSPVVLLHGSGPGVSAWANWRANLPGLATRVRVIAPDMVGFGYTERPDAISYNLETWIGQLEAFLDALELHRVSLVGNSFGGALSLAFATSHPDRVDRMVLMGSAGLSFPVTDGLSAVWGYQPSVENMRALLDIFAFDRSLVTDELAEVRYRASVLPGAQEAFAAMFPPPHQDGVNALAVDEDLIAALPHEVLIIHGREDQVLPLAGSLRLFDMIDRSQLHVFGRCGHWTQIEHAAAFNELVGDFLAGAPSR